MCLMARSRFKGAKTVQRSMLANGAFEMRPRTELCELGWVLD